MCGISVEGGAWVWPGLRLGDRWYPSQCSLRRRLVSFDDDPEEILASSHLLWLLPADVVQPRQNGSPASSPSRASHTPPQAGTSLTSGRALEGRETCLVAGQARKRLSASCSVHGINCCLFKRV